MNQRRARAACAVLASMTLAVGITASCSKSETSDPQHQSSNEMQSPTGQSNEAEAGRAQLTELARSLSLWRSHVSNYRTACETITSIHTALVSRVTFSAPPLRARLVHPLVLFCHVGNTNHPTYCSFKLDVPTDDFPLVHIQGITSLLVPPEAVAMPVPKVYQVSKGFGVTWSASTFRKTHEDGHPLVDSVPRTIGFWSSEDELIGYYDPSGVMMSSHLGAALCGAYKTIAKACFFSWPECELLGTLCVTGMPPEKVSYPSWGIPSPQYGTKDALGLLDKAVLDASFDGSNYQASATYDYADRSLNEGIPGNFPGFEQYTRMGAHGNFGFMATSHVENATQ